MHYFDCVLHAIVRDDAVHGISGLARDITRERENETRFTELFQTLREGVYLASADDRHHRGQSQRWRKCSATKRRKICSTWKFRHCTRMPRIAREERNQAERTGIPARSRSHAEASPGRAPRWLRCIRRRPSAIPPESLCDIRELLWMSPSSAKWSGAFTGSRNLPRRLMDSFPDLVVALDTEARYTFVSPQIYEILGYRPEELIGKSMGGRTDPADRTAMIEMFDDLISEPPLRRPDRIPHAAQERRHGACSAPPPGRCTMRPAASPA